MGLRPTFNQGDIAKRFVNALERVEKAILMRFQYIGEQFIKEARANGDYLDQTGNLRSSIGYLILKNGEVYKENFSKAGRGSDQKQGLEKGLAYAQSIVESSPSGYVLIVVAGMEYAAAVESKGRDVLTGSSYGAETALKQAIQQIANKI
jgi:hypothetical protein